jgi:Predicted transcription factor, homolog of eukaryotic MBF1
MPTIGDRIKLKRKELGLTQAELGAEINVTDRAVSKWEQNEGNPDVSLIADLAKALGVTLDYLMLGKEPEEKIIIKTPKEMLIETDNPAYLEKVNDLTFSDLYKNQLVNVFTFLVDSGKINYYYDGRCRSNDYVTKILYLCLISNKLDKLSVFGFNDIGFADNNEWTKEMIDAFANDERVSDETKKYVLTTHCRTLKGRSTSEGINSETRHRYGNWQDMYPKFLDAFAAAKKWEWVKYILDVAEAINESAMAEYNERKDIRYGDGNNYHIKFNTPKGTYQTEKYVQVMVINDSTLQCLLDEKQYDLLDQANAINKLIGKSTIDNKTIELQKMKTSTDVSLKERLVFEFTNNYILNYSGLLNSDTVTVKGPSREEDKEGYLECLLKQYKDLYKEIILENPTSLIELSYICVAEEKMNKLFQIAVDYEIEDLISVLMEGNIENILQKARDIFTYTETKVTEDYNGYSPRQQINYLMNGKWIEASNIKYSFGLLKVEETSEIPTNVKDAIKYFNRIKEQIFKEWVENVEGNISHIRVAKENEEEYERLRKEITSEFLIGQIATGNEEVATIKLCVRLESILKHKYGYSGDLITMLDSFFNGPLKQIETNKPWDDEDINYESQMEEYYRQTELNELHEKWTRYLSKLRMKRNNLVHAEKSSVDFTTEDLKQCINIVEEIDK